MSLDTVEAVLLECCAVPNWAAGIAAGRPYYSTDQLLAKVAAVLQKGSNADIDTACSAQPRIDTPPLTSQGLAAAWARAELSSLEHSSPDVALPLAEAVRTYEIRFGRSPVIHAQWLSAQDVLEAIRRRLLHSEATERAATINELIQITSWRLERRLS